MSRDSEANRAERVVDEGWPGALDSGAGQGQAAGARRGGAARRLRFAEGKDPTNTVKSRRGRIPDATDARLPTDWQLARGYSCARLRAGHGLAVPIPNERT